MTPELSAALKEEINRIIRKHQSRDPKYQRHVNERIQRTKIRDRFRVRLAGWTGNNKIDLNEDIERFSKLESPLVDWRDKIEKYNDPNTDQLTSEQEEAVAHFRNKGGHISRWPPEKIEYMMRHGIVLFLEWKIREELYATFGSVAMLSAAPYTGTPAKLIPIGKDGARYEKVDYELHPTLPNLDLRDVFEVAGYTPESQKKVLFICRSTVADSIKDAVFPNEIDANSIQDESFKRMGFAARGKCEAFNVGKMFGNTLTSMNIGLLFVKGDWQRGLYPHGCRNVVSNAHNDWAFWHGPREKYADHIIPDKVTMFWDSLGNPIDYALDKLQNNEDSTLRKKCWNIDQIIESSKDTYQKICTDIETGEHAPWGDL